MRKLHIWDSKRCASQFCHSKHRLRKNGTTNVRHLIILPFGVFSLFSFSFSCIWEGEMPLLPLCICVSLHNNHLVADRSYRLSRSCLSYRTQPSLGAAATTTPTGGTPLPGSAAACSSPPLTSSRPSRLCRRAAATWLRWAGHACPGRQRCSRQAAVLPLPWPCSRQPG